MIFRSFLLAGVASLVLSVASASTHAAESVFRSEISVPILFTGAANGAAPEVAITLERTRWRHDETISIPIVHRGRGTIALFEQPEGWSYANGRATGPLGTPRTIEFEIHLVDEGVIVDRAPVTIEVVGDLATSMPPRSILVPGEAFTLRPTIANAIADAEWEFVEGQKPTWLDLDENSGEMTGTAPTVNSRVEGLVLSVVDQTDLKDAETDPFVLQVGQALHAVTAWGEDTMRQVRDATTASNVVQISTGMRFGVVLLDDGSISAWGDNGNGQVSNAPTGTGFKQVAAGTFQAYALRENGSIVGWGDAQGSAISGIPTGNFEDISAGYRFGLALRENGEIAAWGTLHTGNATAPAGSNYTEIEAGEYHAVALTTGGEVVTWGANNNNIVSSSPKGSGFTDIATGSYHALALRADGSIVAWGHNNSGQVSNTPSEAGFVDIAAGYYSSFALRADGSIVSWGNDSSSLISGTPTSTGWKLSDGYGFTAFALKPE